MESVWLLSNSWASPSLFLENIESIWLTFSESDFSNSAISEVSESEFITDASIVDTVVSICEFLHSSSLLSSWPFQMRNWLTFAVVLLAFEGEIKCSTFYVSDGRHSVITKGQQHELALLFILQFRLPPLWFLPEIEISRTLRSIVSQGHRGI